MDVKEKKEEKNIYELYSSNTFLKIKPAFAIDRIRFCFVKTKNGKSVLDIDCYMDITTAREFAAKIISYRIGKQMEIEKKTAEQQHAVYANAAFKSKLGGTKSEDGSVISRHFTISPASKENIYGIFQGIQCPGSVNSQGLIMPNMSDPSKIDRINVPFESHDDLEACALAIRDACTAYSVRTFK